VQGWGRTAVGIATDFGETGAFESRVTFPLKTDPSALRVPTGPGSPWQNGYGKSFNGRLRDELLNPKVVRDLRRPPRGEVARGLLAARVQA
jgi:hypothetical protein